MLSKLSRNQNSAKDKSGVEAPGCDSPHLMSEHSFISPRLGTSRAINYTTPFAIYKGSLEIWLRCRCLHHKCLNLDRQLSPTCLFPGVPGTS